MTTKEYAAQADTMTARARPHLRWKRFVISQILLPVCVSCALIMTGVHIGANQPDAWYTQFVLWIAQFL